MFMLLYKFIKEIFFSVIKMIKNILIEKKKIFRFLKYFVML